MKIAFFSTQSYDIEYFNRFNKVHELVFLGAALDEKTVNLAAGCGAVCVFVNDKLNSAVIAQLKILGVGLIALRCAGYNNVDIAAAKENNISVVRVPAYSPHAVAEHAVALILTLNRKTHKAYNRVREGNFSLERLTGFDLFGKTIGVIGTGRIGQAFCSIMIGFGCRVLAHDLVELPGMTEKGVVYASMDELLAKSDIISLHCPLTEITRHLIDDKTLAVMKKGVMLINTSRGALVDTKAAIEALKSGQLGYLGIDVYEQEEQLFFHDRSEELLQDDLLMLLMSFPNVLITSHQGFFTAEALEQIAVTTLDNITAAEKGEKAINSVL